MLTIENQIRCKIKDACCAYMAICMFTVIEYTIIDECWRVGNYRNYIIMQA